MPRISPNQALLAVASALLIASAATCAVLEMRVSPVRHAGVKPAVKLSEAAYAPVGRDAPEMKTETWEAPPPQRGGREWVYDVFTPPEIFYNERTRQFSITPPVLEPPPVVEAPPPAPFGLELIEVKRPLFRLQLVGYVGAEGDYRGLFENALTGETFLATKGRKLAGLDLTIEELEVQRRDVGGAENAPRQRVATAIVRDERTGERVTLNDTERRYAAAPVATVALSPGAAPREVREGEIVESEGVVFRIGKIQLAPAAVDVTKVTSDQLSEQRTLTVPTDASAANPPPPRA